MKFEERIRMKKNIVFALLFMISPIMHAQENAPAAKPIFSEKQKQLAKTSLKVALHTLETSVGIFLLYISAPATKNIGTSFLHGRWPKFRSGEQRRLLEVAIPISI